jgi:hypothetical protein
MLWAPATGHQFKQYPRYHKFIASTKARPKAQATGKQILKEFNKGRANYGTI